MYSVITYRFAGKTRKMIKSSGQMIQVSRSQSLTWRSFGGQRVLGLIRPPRISLRNARSRKDSKAFRRTLCISASKEADVVIIGAGKVDQELIDFS